MTREYVNPFDPRLGLSLSLVAFFSSSPGHLKVEDEPELHWSIESGLVLCRLQQTILKQGFPSEEEFNLNA